MANAHTSSVVEFLSQPSAYCESASGVERIETHISWVFLTGDYAYKLKKPVAFDFLDFSTPELRRAACEEEVRLNRRLASDVYLGVRPISIDGAGRYHFGEQGNVVDWVVEMRRLPADRTLAKLIESREIDSADSRRLAALLTRFYRSLPRPAMDPSNYRAQIERHVHANLADLSRMQSLADSQLVKRLHGAQLRTLLLRRELFDERVRQGRIVDGHGDLRPEHVYLLSEPVVLDCIEFNAEYRRIDVLDELGFLAMECDRLGAASVGDAILHQTTDALGDYDPAELLAFYKTYRACVRAKVAALRATQHSGCVREQDWAEARDYLLLAARESTPLPTPVLVVVRGISGSGKSTIASALAATLAAEWLSTDSIRKKLHGDGRTGNNGEKYSPQGNAAVYDELFIRADCSLADGLSVVLDGTFLKADLCERASSLAGEYSAPFVIAECECPDNVARDRVAKRLSQGGSESEAFPELIRTQMQEREPVPAGIPTFSLDTSKGIDECLPRLFRSIASHSNQRQVSFKHCFAPTQFLS